mmetsp:Transcript_3828/g.8198  ORF Transcript_3828/g.8198 Transcript_3828/m.8198 type:complete len:549 (+) Transcript_3828:259-1905(+)
MSALLAHPHGFSRAVHKKQPSRSVCMPAELMPINTSWYDCGMDELELVLGLSTLLLALLAILTLLGQLIGNLCVLLDELGQLLQGAVTTLESDGGLVLAGREEHNGGEALDLNIGVLVLSAVHLGNDDALHLLEALGQLLVDGVQLLAVAAPGGVHLQQHILLGVLHNGVEALADHDGHLAVLVVLGDGGALVVSNSGAINDALGKGLQCLSVHLTSELELLVLLHVEAQNLGALSVLQAKVVGDGLSRVTLVVDSDKHQLALQLLGNGLQGSVDCSVSLEVSGLGPDNQLLVDAGVEDLVRVLAGELNGQGHLLSSHEVLHTVSVNLTRQDNHLTGLTLEVLDGSNAELLQVGSLSDSSLSGLHKGGVLNLLANSLESVVVSTLQGLEVTNNDHSSILLQLSQLVSRINLGGEWTALPLHPVGNAISVTAATVVRCNLAIHEPLDGRVTLNTELLSKLALLGGINLSDHNVGVVGLQVGSGLGVVGLQVLAVTAPGSVELNQRVGSLLDDLIKVTASQHNHILLIVVLLASSSIVVVVLIVGLLSNS